MCVLGVVHAGSHGRRECVVHLTPLIFLALQVNVGCVPKKVMFYAAMHSEFIRDHADYCFDVRSNGFNWR